MSVYTGSCLCGSVTYEAEGEPRRVLNAIVTGVRRLLVALRVNRCCQTNEAKHQYSFDGYFYEVTKERHSVRAASRLSLNVLRFESDLCELNRL